MKRATIKDIAAELGVHPSTVSRALRNHPDIGSSMKAKVMEMAGRLRYRPNATAVHLRTQRTSVVGLVVPGVSPFFFPQIVQGISTVLQDRGHQLMILPTQDRLLVERQHVELLCANAVAGILISVSRETMDLQHVEPALELGIPVVLFDKSLPTAPFPEVVIDDRQVAWRCAARLLEAGCRSLIGVFGPPKLSITQERLAGFELGLQQIRKPERTQLLFARSADEAHHKLLETIRQERPDGLFFMSDETLAGGLAAVRDVGMVVPRDCSVVAISAGIIPKLSNPPIAHYHHDGFAMGKMAAKKLMDRIDDHANPWGRETLATQFVPGNSLRQA